MVAKNELWTAEVFALTKCASSWPHAAYRAFTHVVVGHWVYLMRTIPKIGFLFQPLEDVIRLHFLSFITGHVTCNTAEFDLIIFFRVVLVGDSASFCDSLLCRLLHL